MTEHTAKYDGRPSQAVRFLGKIIFPCHIVGLFLGGLDGAG